MEEAKSHVINRNALPKMYPTHNHEPIFWENLGRAVATFGFLEETLARAIFAFTTTTPYSDEDDQKALEEWTKTLQKALYDQLWNLIESYGKAVREHPDATISNLDELLAQLKEASKLRNVICHGSWQTPNCEGASVPFFVNRQHKIFDTAIDASFLLQLQKHVSELICAVIDTVTYMGWQFPGSNGPGKVIWESHK